MCAKLNKYSFEPTKGLFSQIEERGLIFKPHKNLNELKEDLEDYFKKEQKFRQERNKGISDNLKHLAKRSKELKEPIPLELQFKAFFEFPIMGGRDFFDKHRKWIK